MFFAMFFRFAFLLLPFVHGANGVSGMPLHSALLPVETFRPHYSIAKELKESGRA